MRCPVGSPFPLAGRCGGLPCDRGGRSPHVPPRRCTRRGGGGLPSAPPGTAAPDCALSPCRRTEPGSEERPPPRPGPGPASAERSQPAPTPPPPPPPAAASVRTSSPTIQRARYPPGKMRSGRRAAAGGGEGCGSSWRGPYPSQIPLASSAPDVLGSLNPKRIRAVHAFRGAFGAAEPGTRDCEPLAKDVPELRGRWLGVLVSL